MPENTSIDPAVMSSPRDAQAKRTVALRRSLLRLLKRKPTTAERHMLDRAARLTARAEAAANDHTVPINDVVRIDNAAARARAAWARLAGTRRAPQVLSLAEHLARHGEAS